MTASTPFAIFIGDDDPSRWLLFLANHGVHAGKWFVYPPGPGLPCAEFDTEQDARNWAADRGIEL